MVYCGQWTFGCNADYFILTVFVAFTVLLQATVARETHSMSQRKLAEISA